MAAINSLNSAAGASLPPFVQEFIDKAMSGGVTATDIVSFLETIQTHHQETTGLIIDQQH